jgi:hypothetical protein
VRADRGTCSGKRYGAICLTRDTYTASLQACGVLYSSGSDSGKAKQPTPHPRIAASMHLMGLTSAGGRCYHNTVNEKSIPSMTIWRCGHVSRLQLLEKLPSCCRAKVEDPGSRIRSQNPGSRNGKLDAGIVGLWQ